MKIRSVNRLYYELIDEGGQIKGTIYYKNSGYGEADISCKDKIMLVAREAGSWHSVVLQHDKWVELAQVFIGVAGNINIWTFNKKNYLFKRTGTWKIRLVLLNGIEDELVAFLPVVNWDKQCFDYTMQLNDEMVCESDIALVLLAFHCAVYTMHMLNENLVK